MCCNHRSRVGDRRTWIRNVVSYEPHRDLIAEIAYTNSELIASRVYGYLCIQRLDATANNTVDLAFGWDPTEPVATRPLWMQRVSGTYNFFYFHDGNKNVSDVVSYDVK